MKPFPVNQIRTFFPALSRTQEGNLVCHFDGPAGSQVPRRVADAVSDYLLSMNSNRGAPFPVSQHSDMRLDLAHLTLADFLGTRDPGCIAFGQNMTSLTFALSRALSKSWKPGDEIIVTDLDHDANVTPWVLAAEDAGATIRRIPVRLEDCTLDLNTYRELLSDRTQLVALGYASNATGTINPIKEMIAEAQSVGAVTFVDAVHMAPHGLIDVTDLDCDFLCCSAYKFFGPHLGVMYGKRERLESICPYKLRPESRHTTRAMDDGDSVSRSHDRSSGSRRVSVRSRTRTRLDRQKSSRGTCRSIFGDWRTRTRFESSAPAATE